jgi:hypothetical protein
VGTAAPPADFLPARPSYVSAGCEEISASGTSFLNRAEAATVEKVGAGGRDAPCVGGSMRGRARGRACLPSPFLARRARAAGRRARRAAPPRARAHAPRRRAAQVVTHFLRAGVKPSQLGVITPCVARVLRSRALRVGAVRERFLYVVRCRASARGAWHPPARGCAGHRRSRLADVKPLPASRCHALRGLLPCPALSAPPRARVRRYEGQRAYATAYMARSGALHADLYRDIEARPSVRFN